MVEDDFVELAEAIAVLRAQLREARAARDDGDPRFVVGTTQSCTAATPETHSHRSHRLLLGAGVPASALLARLTVPVPNRVAPVIA